MATTKKAAPKQPEKKTVVSRKQKPFTIEVVSMGGGSWSWRYMSKNKIMMEGGSDYRSSTAAKNAAKSMIDLIKKQDTSIVAFDVK
jgi:hypothetical protein